MKQVCYYSHVYNADILADKQYYYAPLHFVAPVSSPSNFKAIDIRSTSIAFQWDSLSDGINGIIRGYEIICTNQNRGNDIVRNISS